MVVDFQALQFRLIRHLQDRIRGGEITERRLARSIEVSQPHLHNVLKGKHSFSITAADRILRHLNLDLLDLIHPGERRGSEEVAKRGGILKTEAMGQLARINQMQGRDARLKRLAESIDLLAEKDQQHQDQIREIAALRRKAATELHAICADFVVSLNRMLSRGEMTLDPPVFAEDGLREEGPNLIQINTRGRIVQIEFATLPELISTEDFRIPYTMKGSVRAFNQVLLDKAVIEEQLLFYTLEKEKRLWRFFDPRTYRSGPFDQEYLVTLVEQLL